jgi:CheY-like chemotaxis protein
MNQEREALLASEQEARSNAERASQLKDEFLLTLSHELRTPLNALLGWSTLLKRKDLEQARIRQGLDVIERNVRLQSQLIDDLLDMSRIISGKLRLNVQQVELVSIIEAAVETVRLSAMAKGIRLRQVLDPSAGIVSGDPARLQQVVWNLLSNAIKFTPKGGRVQVVLERVDSHVEISVIDTGLGISPEFLPYVFDKFRQADASMTRDHGGLGLGLAIVKHLVELHGGSVKVESAGSSKGATFIVELPLVVVHREQSDNKDESDLVEPGTTVDDYWESALDGFKVLVVDDEPDARELIRCVLEDSKAQVITAGSAREALEILMREQPDVLVSDIGMPQEDGYKFIHQVRTLPFESGGKIPAVALTAYARAEDRKRALMAGYQMHISKPVEPSELIAVVSSLVSLMQKKGDANQ